MQTPVRVLLVDDYAPFRRFVCSALEKTPDLQVIAQASDGLEAVRKGEQLQPDLIILDIGLPTLTGIEVARRLRKLSPGSKILVLTQESSADIAQEVLSLGVLGYVVKAHALSELSAAVEAVLQGKQFVGSGVENLPASITYAIDPNKGLIHTRCVGQVTVDLVLNHFRELERDPVCPNRLDVLLDVHEMTSVPESDELRTVGREIARIRQRVGFGACAIVARGDAVFGMMRVFAVLAEQYFRAICVFRAGTEAEQWLTSNRLSEQ